MKILLNEGKINSCEVTEFPDFSLAISLPHSNLNIIMNADEAEQFKMAVLDGFTVILDASSFAPRYLKRMLNVANTWFNYARHFNVFENSSTLFKRDHNFLDFMPPLSGWPKDLRLFANNLSKNYPESVSSDSFNDWNAAGFDIPEISKEERDSLIKSNAFRMSNAASLGGFIKPAFFIDNVMEFSIGKGSFKFKAVSEECGVIIDHFFSDKEKENIFNAAESWRQVDLFEKAFSLLKNIMRQCGLDEDCYYFNEDDADFEKFSSLFFDFELILQSPNHCQEFIDKYLPMKKEKEGSGITISFS